MGDLYHFPTVLREVPSNDHPQSNAYGFEALEFIPGQDEQPVRPRSSAPQWSPPPVEITSGGLFGRWAVWVGDTRVKIFNSDTNAIRFASELRVMLKGGEL